MRSIRFVLVTSVFLAVGIHSKAEDNAKPGRPNIVIILVDDLGFSDLGCYGSEVETPNIDKLAANGLRFFQFHNAGRCCPTRASLLTGRHPHQVGIGHMTEPVGKPLGFTGPYQGYLNDQCVTIAEVLRGAGYHTLMTGKWHVGVNRFSSLPLEKGFDRYYGCLDGAMNYFRPARDKIMLDSTPVETGDDFYSTDTFTDYACRFISEATSADDRPFFLYLAYNAPHWPLNSKWSEFSKYRGRYKDGWRALMRSRLEKQKALGLVPRNIEPAPHVGPEWDSLTEAQRDDLDAIMAAYAGCIDSIDQNVGKLVKHLEQQQQLDNTIIFLLSDNGACQEGGTLGKGSEEMVKNPPLETVEGVRLGLAWANACNTPFRLYKHFIHEGGTCTPLIVHWPATIKEDQAGHFVRQFAYLPDFMPTWVELAETTYPASAPPHEGTSMLPLLKGKEAPIHTAPIYWEHEGNAGVRWGEWKLVREYHKPWELFDISTDPTELHDQSSAEPAQRKEMIDKWIAWAEKNHVAYPERFSMYEYLRERNEGKKGSKAKSRRAQ